MYKRIIIFSLLFSLLNLNLYSSNADLIIVKDNEIEYFIKNILSPILTVANVNEKSIHIYIVNNSTPNAFVFQGQNIFIHTGLITSVDSVDEIAGVLAHELGHITAGHLSRGDAMYSKASIFVLLGLAALLLAAPMLNNNNGNAIDIIGFLTYGTNQIATTSFLSYSRAEESQADDIGIDYISKTNYNPNGFYIFMNKLYQQEDKTIYTDDIYNWYSSHPLTKSRISFIQNYINNYPYKQKYNVQHNNLQQQLSRIKAKILSYTLSYKEINNIYKNSNTQDALYAKMIANYRENNYNKAINYGNQLLKINPKDIYTQDILGDIYFYNNQNEKAIYYYKLSLGSNQEDDITTFKISKSYLINKNYNLALKYINISLQINQFNPAGWDLKSIILSKLNQDSLADLAVAYKYNILNDKKRALFFANKALNSLPRESKEWIDAKELIVNINTYN